MQFLHGAAWMVFAVVMTAPRCFGQTVHPAAPSTSNAQSVTSPQIERRTTVDLPLRTRPGFRVEQVYAVPRDKEGSWVALTVDQRGRLIASDQAGDLYRITLGPGTTAAVESIRAPVGHAHGLLYANDSLYAVVAEKEHDGPGLYRVRDRDGDDQFDEATLLMRLEGTREHGPHSAILGPDGQSLYVCAGNKTRLPATAIRSRVPPHWGENWQTSIRWFSIRWFRQLTQGFGIPIDWMGVWLVPSHRLDGCLACLCSLVVWVGGSIGFRASPFHPRLPPLRRSLPCPSARMPSRHRGRHSGGPP